MSDEALQQIISEIGLLADKAEASKWSLAEAVSTAYMEFKPYSRGLTAGLCSRLRKSTDSIYGLRDAWNLKNLLNVSDSALSVSHFATLSRLKDKFNLTEEDCITWLGWAQEIGASVRDMSMEISTAHCADAKKSYLKLVNRVDKDIQRLWDDSETIGLPDSLRAACKAALGALRDWIAQLLEWGNGNST
jgi:hypothetical protein